MRAIDRTLVDEVWRELTAYAPARVASEAQAFLDLQPHAAAFSVQKAALGLAFLLFKILEASLGRPFPELAEPRLLDAYAGTQAWLRQWEGAPPVEVLQALGQAEHASLAAYILEVFYAGGAVPGEYDETVRASLYCLLKTLTDALDLGHVED